MSSEAAAAVAVTPDAGQTARRAALRLAFGVTGCFAVVEALGWDATFIAPMLAAQMLVKLQRPPSAAQGAGLILLFLLSSGGVLAVTMAFMANPAVLVLALGLILYFSFYAHLRGAPEMATLLVQISAVSLPVIAIVSPDTAFAFAGTLVSAGALALLTVWVTHAALPEPADAGAGREPLKKVPAEHRAAARQALLDTLVLLPVIIWFLLDATETVDMAIVMLIVVVTLLRQADPRKSQSAALGLILGNAIGGIAAVIVCALALMNATFLFFIFACLATSLLFAGLIVSSGDRAPLYALAFATFILLLGLGISPLPGGSSEAFMSRLLNVLLASAYAIGSVSVLERWRRL